MLFPFFLQFIQLGFFKLFYEIKYFLSGFFLTTHTNLKMSADENQAESFLGGVEDENQGEMDTSALLSEEKDANNVEGEETPMEDSAADGEKADDKKEKQEDILEIRKPYPNLLSVLKLDLEDIKVVVTDFSDYWDDTCLNIKYTKAKKGFMRMKFPTEEAADVVFNKLQLTELNGKRFVFEPQSEDKNLNKDNKGNKKDYSLYVNNIPQGVTVKEVQALFPQARNVVIPLNEEDQNQGYAIVECHSLHEAETTISDSKDLKLKDNVLTIDLISHNSKDDDDKKSKKHQNNQQNKKGRFSNQQSRRNQQVNKKGKQDQRGRGGLNSSDMMRGKRSQQMQQMQQRKQRWSPDRRQQGRKPSQYMHKGRMDGGGRRQLMDSVGSGGQWNQGGQNVTAALSQTSELLKGLTSLLGQQLLNPNQMGGQGDSQYGQQNWGQGMDQGGNYSGGYQSGSGTGGSSNRGFSNDNMNYGNYGSSSGGWGSSYRGYN